MDNEVARAIWARFEAEVEDELLRATAGAFALIACADAHLVEAEVEEFIEHVRDEPAFVGADLEQLEVGFRELAHAFAMDFATGEALATRSVQAVRGDPSGTETVLRAAQAAMVADDRLEPAEERTLERLCHALGVDPSLW